jgi:hypothetical protein
MVHNFDASVRHPIDYIAFKWGSRTVSNRPPKLKVVSLPSSSPGGLFRSPTPSSSFRRLSRKSPEPNAEEPIGPHPGYLWLDHLPRSLDDVRLDSTRLSPNMDNWMIESANQFVSSLQKIVESICSRGRSVWFMVRPLENRNLPGPSAAHVSFSHWGILVSGMTRSQLEDLSTETMPLGGPVDSIWGDLHELRNIYGAAKYECSTYRARDNRKATKLEYLGQTEITDEELFEFGEMLMLDGVLILGHELIRSNPKYHLLKNNCQVWVEKFLEKVCPSAETERTIAQVLRSSSK